mgnify:CR=1 FL=1
MKNNTQEKNLVERNEDNIFEKIKSFFKNLFGKKEIEINNVVDDDIEMEMEKSESFRSNMRNIYIDENNIFELQRRYQKGEIADNDLTQEQINALCQLYDSQIADLKRSISAKEKQLAKYKKK